MSKRENIKTTIAEIVEYWSKRVDDWDLTVEWGQAHKCCWRCGYETPLERAHIIPDSLGGLDEPSNFVLLCTHCHASAPNVLDPEIMWDWLKAYSTNNVVPFSMALAVREYKFIYGQSPLKELEQILKETNKQESDFDFNEIKQQLFSVGNGTSTHFGQPYLNTSTYAGFMRMFLKDLALKYGVEFPKEISEEEYKTPWYF